MTNIARLQAFEPLHGVGTKPSWNMHHRRNPALCGPLMILAIILLLTITAPAQAEEPSCSLSRAASDWTFTDNGTVIGVGPRAALGKFTLTAGGNLLNGVATSSLNGVIAEETFYGTYTVNSDCTGTLSVQIFSGSTELFAVTMNMIFDKKMEHMRGLFTSVVTPSGASLPTVIAAEGRRE
jgi:hypothetical protein